MDFFDYEVDISETIEWLLLDYKVDVFGLRSGY